MEESEVHRRNDGEERDAVFLHRLEGGARLEPRGEHDRAAREKRRVLHYRLAEATVDLSM